jgi:hypothetical protein
MAEFNQMLVTLARTIVQGESRPITIYSAYSAYSADVAVDVYRNNYHENLQDALAGAYPVIKQLVGDDFFRTMAREFIQHHPSCSGNLHHYGAELANFVATFSPARELAYLADVAQLEWACHVAYFAPDEESHVLSKLAEISTEQYANVIFQTHLASQIICSAYPIVKIWHAHQPRVEPNFQIDLEQGGDCVLVSRVADAVQVNEILASEANWLRQIQQGVCLGDATDSVLAQGGEFDLQATLIKLVIQNVLVDVTFPAV